MKRIVYAAALLTSLSGCATTAKYEAKLNSWVGQPADSLVMAWGPPASSYPLQNGGQVLQYSGQRTLPIGGYTYTTPQTTYTNGTVNAYGSRGGYANANYSGTSTTYVQQQTPVYNVNLTCTTTFSVDASGYIVSWRYQGNDCVSAN